MPPVLAGKGGRQGYHHRIVKIVFFADLHLDAPFAWLGGSQLAARRRRQSLRDTLGTIIRLADVIHADALLCGGDLFEQARSPRHRRVPGAGVRGAEPIRVFLAPGNHDWYGPETCTDRPAGARTSTSSPSTVAGPAGGRRDALGRGPPGAGRRSGSWTNSRSTGADRPGAVPRLGARRLRGRRARSSRTRRSTRPRSRRPASTMRWSDTTTGHGTRSGTPTRATRTS